MRYWDKKHIIVLGMWMSGWGGISCLSEASVEYFPGGNVGDDVNTDFALSVPSDVKNGRMTAENTQQDQVFRGMKNMVLLPFQTSKNGNLVDRNTRLKGSQNLPLGEIGENFTGGDQKNPTNSDLKAKMFSNINIPGETNAFLVYAESAQGGDGFVHGKIVPKITTVNTPRDISFEQAPVTVYTTATVTQCAEAQSMLNLLNGVAQAQWKDYSDVSNKEHQFYKYYWKFMSNNAASAKSVLAILQDTYNTMNGIFTSTEVTDAEKLCAQSVMNAITSDAVGVAQVKARAAEAADHTSDAWVLEYVNPTYNFPRNLNLPDGAVQVAEANLQFVFTKEAKDAVGMQTADYNQYTYPVSLYYMGNSDLATSQQLQTSFASTQGTWADFLKTYDGHGASSAVGPEVASIAMIKPLDYAVGVMQSSVRLTTEPMTDSHDRTVLNPKFRLTGVLVGGQKPVDWEFVPQFQSEVYYTVYDKDLSVEAQQPLVAKTYSSPVYTLVFPSVEQEYVNVCLEFENQGDDFYGYSGKLIPSGTKFYLVSALKMDGTQHVVIPEGVDRVFMSDHITIANFTLGPTSLHNAFNVVPDLRPSRMEIGMTVDLTWKDGLVFGQKEI